MATVKKNEPLYSYTTFRIGGPAELFYIPESEDELASLCSDYPDALVLGGGSNLLVSDEGVPVVISTEGVKSFTFSEAGEDLTRITVGAGYSLTSLARAAFRMGLSGLEFTFGIPGTVGGSVVMNAGAMGGEIKDRLMSVVMGTKGGLREMMTGDLGLSYRSSAIPGGSVVASASFVLSKGDKREILDKMKQGLKYRKERQPLEFPSAGSVFKNPPGLHAGKVIDELGLKGMRIGDAEVSAKHANFIINRGSARASHVYELVCRLEAAVYEKMGIRLEREIKLAGSFA